MRKIAKPETLIKALEKRFRKGKSNIHAFDREGDGTVCISAEHGDEIDGFPLADYYDFPYFDPSEANHRFGINLKLVRFCEAAGWHLEWENPGCIIAYKDH